MADGTLLCIYFARDAIANLLGAFADGGDHVKSDHTSIVCSISDCFRVLGFYRVPPVTGRLVNMTSEIFMLAQKALKKTFYVSPGE